MKSTIAVFALIALSGCARYDYPPPTDGGRNIRVDRLTGRTEVLTPRTGWKALATPPPVVRYDPPSPIPLTPECAAARSRNAYADLIADIPCDAEELARAETSLAATQRRDSTQTRTLP